MSETNETKSGNGRYFITRAYPVPYLYNEQHKLKYAAYKIYPNSEESSLLLHELIDMIEKHTDVNYQTEEINRVLVKNHVKFEMISKEWMMTPWEELINRMSTVGVTKEDLWELEEYWYKLDKIIDKNKEKYYHVFCCYHRDISDMINSKSSKIDVKNYMRIYRYLKSVEFDIRNEDLYDKIREIKMRRELKELINEEL